MIRSRDMKARRAVFGVLILLLACVASRPDRAGRLGLINESPSLPRGLYLRRPDVRPSVGSVVATPQPAIARDYLGGLGMPADVLLIKRVAAGPGDRVCRTGDRLESPGRRVTILARDRRGARLPAWSGCRRLRTGELFLLGDTPSSFDSRYFGPVQAGAVEGVYRETLTW